MTRNKSVFLRPTANIELNSVEQPINFEIGSSQVGNYDSGATFPQRTNAVSNTKRRTNHEPISKFKIIRSTELSSWLVRRLP